MSLLKFGMTYPIVDGIINPSNPPKPAPYYTKYLELLSKEPTVHSIRLRGSVAWGYSSKEFSDIDVIVITDYLNEYVSPEIPNLDVIVQTPEEVVQAAPMLKSILQLTSYPIVGPDITKDWGPVYVENMIPPYTEDEIMEILQESFNHSLSAIKYAVRLWFNANLWRSTFYSRDMYFCLESLRKLYPSFDGWFNEIEIRLLKEMEKRKIEYENSNAR